VTVRHLLEVTDLTPQELVDVLDAADAPRDPILAGKAVALIFEKPSSRTRNSAEVAVAQLGGHPAYITRVEVDFDGRESVEDVTRTLQGYYDVIAARVFDHTVLERMVSVADVPIINLLSDLGHPVQVLADLLTIRQHVGPIEGVTIAWIGDYSNVARSLALGALSLGANMRFSCPNGYGPDEVELDRLAGHAQRGASVSAHARPVEAVVGANVVTTDAWYSMGQEAEKEIRARAFEGFRVDSALMTAAKPSARFLHCLPAHRGQEVTSEVLDSPASLIWPQAHNRLHTFRGLLRWLQIQGSIR
jgi:ornithine carbamoyltransferase